MKIRKIEKWWFVFWGFRREKCGYKGRKYREINF